MAPLSRFVIWIRFSTLDVESTQKWKRISWLPGWTGVKTQIDYVAITSLWLYMCCISFVFTCGLMRIPCKQKKYCTTRHYENPVMNVQQDFMKCNDRVLNTYDSETWHPGVTFFGSLEGGVSNLWAVPHIPVCLKLLVDSTISCRTVGGWNPALLIGWRLITSFSDVLFLIPGGWPDFFHQHIIHSYKTYISYGSYKLSPRYRESLFNQESILESQTDFFPWLE